MKLHRPWAKNQDGLVVDVTPEDAGWSWTGLRVLRLRPGMPVTIRTGPSEIFVLPLAGTVDVDVAGQARFSLAGRDSVFSGPSDFVYVGRDGTVELHSAAGAEVALPASRCAERLPAVYGPAAEVPIESRGAGNAARYVRNFGVPGVWEHAEKLICCEVVTPPGNWSSYPPHKHDASEPCTVVNEEIYYYRIAGSDQVTPSRTGFGYHRTYTGPEHEAAGLGPIDELVEVRDQDVVLIPYGYHGPCIAAPGYPMYYLNVMAGHAQARAMVFCDDPAHAWIRDSWPGSPTNQTGSEK
jgi:5-deoxy-glucuronate isomerase